MCSSIVVVKLRSLINSCVETATTKFITGACPLTEEGIGKYFTALDK
jgi:hypothetical protein